MDNQKLFNKSHKNRINEGKGIESIRLLANDSGLSRILGNNSFFSPNKITKIIKKALVDKAVYGEIF